MDKANVLEVSQLWRATVIEVAAEFPDVTLEHQFVDAMSMHLMKRPRDFDVVVTENMFGDILTDESSVITGSLGMLPSATIGGKVNLYEPAHGSAPRYAGKNIANPLATILTGAMLLRHSFGLEAEADAIVAAVRKVLEQGFRTQDLARTNPEGLTVLSTSEMGAKVREDGEGNARESVGLWFPTLAARTKTPQGRGTRLVGTAESRALSKRRHRVRSKEKTLNSAPKTLFEKVWEQHVVVEPKGEPTLLYIDLQSAARGDLAAGV